MKVYEISYAHHINRNTLIAQNSTHMQLISISYLFLSSFEVSTNIIECCELEIENGDNKCDVWRQQ